jgi:hypothetical protein
MNGRVYDPTLGRFLTPDPIVQHPKYSQSWNRYSYVNNTPSSLFDPTGFEEEQGTIDEVVAWGTRRRTNPHRWRESFAAKRINFVPNYGYRRSSGVPSTPSRSEWMQSNAYWDTRFDDACTSNDVTCVAFVDSTTLPYPNFTFVASVYNKDISTFSTLKSFGAVTGHIGAGIPVIVNNWVGAFNKSQYGQAFRGARTANLTKLLEPMKAFATRLGAAGLFAELLADTLQARKDDNYAPLIVTATGAVIAIGVTATVGATAGLVFGLAYGAADYFGVFEFD